MELPADEEEAEEEEEGEESCLQLQPPVFGREGGGGEVGLYEVEAQGTEKGQAEEEGEEGVEDESSTDCRVAFGAARELVPVLFVFCLGRWIGGWVVWIRERPTESELLGQMDRWVGGLDQRPTSYCN